MTAIFAPEVYLWTHARYAPLCGWFLCLCKPLQWSMESNVYSPYLICCLFSHGVTCRCFPCFFSSCTFCPLTNQISTMGLKLINQKGKQYVFIYKHIRAFYHEKTSFISQSGENSGKMVIHTWENGKIKLQTSLTAVIETITWFITWSHRWCRTVCSP